jgi:two-component system, LytTR family, sensor kinase
MHPDDGAARRAGDGIAGTGGRAAGSGRAFRARGARIEAVRQRYVVAALCCSVLALITTAKTYFYVQVSGLGLSLVDVLLSQTPVWIVWAAVAPTFARWGQRFRLAWPPSGRAVLANVAGVAATLLLFALVDTTISELIDTAQVPGSVCTTFLNRLVNLSLLATIVYGATIGVGYAAEHTRRVREVERLQAQLTQAQLSALRMQLNPHFLFNALHTIAVLVREQDERQAVDLIERLGDVLRLVLRTSNELETPLEGEVAFLRKYLEIEQARFRDRLRISIALEPGTEAALVPQLIIQPLVENALRHGLAPRARPGALTIRARRREQALEVIVADDGVGLRPGWDATDGLGLPNVRARLQRMYGTAGRLTLAAAPGCGVVATITMPFRSEAAR